MKSRPLVLAAAVAALCACAPDGGQPQAPAPASGTTAPSREPAQAGSPRADPPPAARTWTDASWRFRINAPRRWTMHRDFTHGYLPNGSWKTDAAPDSRGTAIVAFALPGSDEITSAEIRIGASRDSREVARCTTPPQAARSGSVHREMIGDE